MSAEDERWLRERLTTVVEAAPPPADLANRAERTAGRIRRRRVGTAAVVAVVVAVPLVLGRAWITDSSLPPARPTDPACTGSGKVLPDQQGAVTPADVAWPYRGDPALRPALDRVMAGTIEVKQRRVTRPLYAQRLTSPAGHAVFVFAVQFPPTSAWQAVARVLPADATADLPGRAGSAATAWVPRLVANTQISLLVAVEGGRGPLPVTERDRWGNLLVALGAPGADRVEYRACYRGRPFEVAGTGDVLVREVGPVDAPGRLRVLAGNQLLATGEPGRPVLGLPALVLPAVEPVPVPAGTREVQRLTGQGERGPVPDTVARVPAARILARCRGPVPLEVAVADRRLGQVPCDDEVHVLADGVALEAGRPLAVSGLPAVPGSLPEPVSYDVVVVTAG